VSEFVLPGPLAKLLGKKDGDEGIDPDVIADRQRKSNKDKQTKKDAQARNLEQWVMKNFGEWGQRLSKAQPDLDRQLLQGARDVTADYFCAQAIAYGAFAGLAGLMLGTVAGFLFLGIGKAVFAGIVGLATGAFGGYFFQFVALQGTIKKRASNMNQKLAFAINFMSSLASAGVSTPIIFESIGQQVIYGEIAVESKKLTRAVNYLGRDLVTAIREGARRSPSHLWSEFLYGCINTINSGGDLVTYFTARANQYTEEQHRKARAFFSTLGIVSEIYVILVGATPLFLVITLSITVVLGGSVDPGQVNYLMAFLIIPALQGAFAYALLKMTPS
jgi:flagellar protein FlaJ